MRKFHQLCTLLFLTLSVLSLSAQSYLLTDNISVRAGNDELSAAWAGGLTAPQFNAIDLDRDGLNDLAVFDRYDDRLLTFRNAGTAGNPNYVYAPEFEYLFPEELATWVLLRDYDGDGNVDIFTALSGISYVRVFRNLGPQNGDPHTFVPENDTLLTLYPPVRPVYVPRTDIPNISDLDGDGDLDILGFDIGGSFLVFNRNLSMENYGDLTHLEFEVASRCYGHIREDDAGCSFDLNLPPCAPGERIQDPGGSRHAGSTTLALNLNGDAIPDLLIGDVDCTNLSALFASDTVTVAAHMDSIQDDFPRYSTSVNLPYFPAPFAVDVDQDGLQDLLVAPNDRQIGEDQAGVWYFRNTGTANAPNFQVAEIGFLQNDMVETGTGSIPTFFDYNNDGKLDLLVGNLGRFDSLADFIPALWLYENTGTLAAPAYELVDEDYLNVSQHPDLAGNSWLAPAAQDLDNDGDPDLVIGDAQGHLHHLRNDPVNGIANFTYLTDQYENIQADLFTHPTFDDINDDGFADLLIGNIRGRIHYYRNDGSPSQPLYVLVTDTLGGINITDFTGSSFTNGFARPVVVDYDDDGEKELLVGTVEGEIEIYDDLDLTPGAVFTMTGKLLDKDFGRYVAPAAARIDGTGELTFVLGNGRGGLQLIRHTSAVDRPEAVGPPPTQWQLFPNPARDRVRLVWEGPWEGTQEMQLVDMTGRILLNRPVTARETEFEVGQLAAGMYTVVLLREGRRSFRKLVVQ